jgi:hypothetical protein
MFPIMHRDEVSWGTLLRQCNPEMFAGASSATTYRGGELRPTYYGELQTIRKCNKDLRRWLCSPGC